MAWQINEPGSNIAEISVQAEYAGQVIVNRWHYRVSAWSTPYLSTYLIDGVRDLWRANILPLVSEGYKVKYYVAKAMAPIPVPAGRFVYSVADVRPGNAADEGEVAGDPAPAYVAATVQLKSAFLGRSYMGSKRISGLLDSDTDPANPNYLTTGAHTVLQAAATAVFTPQIPGGDADSWATPCIASITKGVGKDPTSQSNWFDWAVILRDAIVNEQLGSQVSRKSRGAG